jgi:poly-gamma-glutamate synthesis protein (capsule biosynthesis protein)
MNPVRQRPSNLHWTILLVTLLALSACQLTPPSVSTAETIAAPAAEQTQSAVHTPTNNPPQPESTPTPEPPQPLILGVPPQWAQAAAQAVENLAGTDSNWGWLIEISTEPNENLSQGNFDIALLLNADGIPVGSRPLSLAVPLSSSWVHISLPEAEQILAEGSPYAAVMDWSDITPDMRSLLVEGLHPSDPNYPLREDWSLHSSPGFESAANELAPWLAQELTSDLVIHLAAVGDVMLDRALGEAVLAGDVGYPFSQVEEMLSSADITLGNLESALGDLGTPENKGYTFRAPKETVETLSLAGFDVLSLANNHAMDYGAAGLLQAVHLLEARGINTVGAGADDAAAHRPVIFEMNGIKLAFLAYVDVPVEFRGFDARSWIAGENVAGVAWAGPNRIRTDVAAALTQADLVVVILHSGYENVLQPSPPQVAAAHAAIEAGAKLVIGHHAHVLQPIELFRDGVIAYGLGNFAFEDAGPPETGLLNIWIDARGVRELELVPLLLDTDGRPFPAGVEISSAILESFYKMTMVFEGPD